VVRWVSSNQDFQDTTMIYSRNNPQQPILFLSHGLKDIPVKCCPIEFLTSRDPFL